MIVSAVMITFIGGWVIEKVVEPHLGEYNGIAEAFFNDTLHTYFLGSLNNNDKYLDIHWLSVGTRRTT